MLTTKVMKRLKFGNALATVVEVTFDNSYTTGGKLLDNGKMGLSAVYLALAEPTGTYIFPYDHVSKKLKAVVVATGAEAAAATDLSAVKTYVLAVGW